MFYVTARGRQPEVWPNVTAGSTALSLSQEKRGAGNGSAEPESLGVRAKHSSGRM